MVLIVEAHGSQNIYLSKSNKLDDYSYDYYTDIMKHSISIGWKILVYS